MISDRRIMIQIAKNNSWYYNYYDQALPKLKFRSSSPTIRAKTGNIQQLNTKTNDGTYKVPNKLKKKKDWIDMNSDWRFQRETWEEYKIK